MVRVVRRYALVVALVTLLGCASETPAPPDDMATADPTVSATAPPRVDAPGAIGKVGYIHEGDLWVKTIPDGDPVRITDDALSSSPRWSQSGEWLLVGRGDGAMVMRPDGSHARQVEGYPEWAHGSDRLASIAPDGAVVIEDADGSGRREVVAAAALGAVEVQRSHLKWAWDEQSLAYAEVRRNTAYTPEARQATPIGKEVSPAWLYAGLWRVDPLRGGATELYNTGSPPSGLVLADWSLDSQHLLFWNAGEFCNSCWVDGVPMYALSIVDGAVRQLTKGMLGASEFWALSPRGEQLAISGSGRDTWTHKRVAVLGIASGDPADLTEEGVAAMAPAWSSDASRIAYVAAPDDSAAAGSDETLRRAAAGKRRLWVMNADGTQQRQLTQDPAYRDERPAWSGDGAHVLFARIDADDRAGLWLMPIGGGAPSRVVDDLSPPVPTGDWLGYSGYIAWDQLFDAFWRLPEGPLAATPTADTSGTVDAATGTARLVAADSRFGEVIDAVSSADVDAFPRSVNWERGRCAGRAVYCPGLEPGAEADLFDVGETTFLVTHDALRPTLDRLLAGEPLQVTFISRLKNSQNRYVVGFEAATPKGGHIAPIGDPDVQMSGMMLTLDASAPQPIVRICFCVTPEYHATDAGLRDQPENQELITVDQRFSR